MWTGSVLIRHVVQPRDAIRSLTLRKFSKVFRDRVSA